MIFSLTKQQKQRLEKKKKFFKKIEGETLVDDFPMFIDRQELIRYVVRYELFKKILDIKGSIVECGVYRGASLMLFAKLSAIFEPYAFNRQIIGFDTFGAGFPSVSKDKDGSKAYCGDLADADIRVLKESIKFYNQNRYLNHVKKIRLIKGDATRSIPKFFKDNSNVLVALLYLDFDLYEPTKMKVC